MSSYNNSSYYQSLPTTGAVAVTNDKGEKTMQKVKVQRYITGRRPRFATNGSSSESNESSEEEDNESLTTNWRNNFQQQKSGQHFIGSYEVKSEPMDDEEDDEQDMADMSAKAANDPRLRRLMSRREVKMEESDDDDHQVVADRRHPSSRRHVLQPQVLALGSEDKEGTDDAVGRRRGRRETEDQSSDDSEADDENVERRHEVLRQKRDVEEEELLAKDDDEEGGDDEEEEEESEYDEYTDSEDETGPRLKPVFVRKKERITVLEKEKEEDIERQHKESERRAVDERRKQTLKIIEDDVRREDQEREDAKEEESIKRGIASVLTDDENEETSYEIWKLRELKRIKRDKDEAEAFVRDKAEVERLRAMTEEERQLELQLNPKVITNAAPKGKYRFLQKYYHRGVFFLDEEDEVFKRDFAQPTLEDHFDRTVVPKVMQVKNFGRSGRTKYTHLVDQDTTAFDSAWTNESTQSTKFHTQQAGGMKQVFDRPSGKRK